MIKLGKPNAIDVFNDKKKLLDFGLKIDIKNEINKLLSNKYEYKNKVIKRIDYEE